MAKNTVVLLVLVGVVVQLCSVVPPAAVAGRVLVDKPKCPQGGIGGDLENGINGGGELKCGDTSVVNGAAWVDKDGQHVKVGAVGAPVIKT